MPGFGVDEPQEFVGSGTISVQVLPGTGTTLPQTSTFPTKVEEEIPSRLILAVEMISILLTAVVPSKPKSVRLESPIRLNPLPTCPVAATPERVTVISVVTVILTSPTAVLACTLGRVNEMP